MNIQEQIIPYEILFRLQENGTVSGCHMRQLMRLIDLDSGKVYDAKELNPLPITGEQMEAVLGAINSALVASLDETNAQIERLIFQLDASKALVSDMANERDTLIESLNNAKLKIADLENVTEELMEQKKPA